MCGRFNLRANPYQLAEFFSLFREPVWQPRFNIAPTQTVLAVRQRPEGRTADPLRWGLVPFWSKSLADGSKMINARSETVDTKPAFRAAFKSRRCIVPASGFYEWEAIEGSKIKQPWHITPTAAPLLAFAGLWESWNSSGGETIETCTILTTSANQFMAEIHDRMPVILDEDDFGIWLDPKTKDPGRLKPLLVPAPDKWLQRQKVSTLINSPRNETPDCLNPL